MTQAKTPEHVVLEGVPYVGPDLHRADPDTGARRCLEGATFPSTLRACLELDQLDTFAQTFADPGVRRRIVPLIQQAQAKDAEAIEHIMRALGEQAGTL